jgi:hypothetical protein
MIKCFYSKINYQLWIEREEGRGKQKKPFAVMEVAEQCVLIKLSGYPL